MNDGGPAFPIPQAESIGPLAYGMSLRDWFAANAPDVPDWWPEMAAIHNQNRAEQTNACISRITSWRYAYADAMIAERTNRP